MSYKHIALKIKSTDDKRIKLTEEQRSEIKELYGRISQRKLAKMFGVSRRLVVFIGDEAKHKRNLECRKLRGGWKQYYDKNNFINEYFDAIKIGLTATPREHEARNTYELFSDKKGKPTVEYSYDEAVLNKVLVPYKAEIIETERLSLGIKGSELSDDLKDQLRRQEINPEDAKTVTNIMRSVLTGSRYFTEMLVMVAMSVLIA